MAWVVGAVEGLGRGFHQPGTRGGLVGEWELLLRSPEVEESLVGASVSGWYCSASDCSAREHSRERSLGDSAERKARLCECRRAGSEARGTA